MAEQGNLRRIGRGSSWPIGGGKATLAIPIKVGLSVTDYYEGVREGKVRVR